MACALLVALASHGLGCGDNDQNNNQNQSVDAGVDGGQVAIAVEVPCEDSPESIYEAPPALTGNRGNILRCAVDTSISLEELKAPLEDYVGTLSGFTSGAQVYRILYETERAGGAPGYSSAVVFVPDTPRADPLPVIVASHGSRGQAGICAPSRMDPSAAWTNLDFQGLVYPVVGGGYAVIAPDLAGYANFGAEGNPPSGYAFADDVARSTLDGVAAMNQLIGSHLTDQVVLTGHSQGGHTALAALAQAESFGVDGTIGAVVVFTPLWLNPRVAGAVLYAPESFPIDGPTGFIAASVFYHYTHAEILDGPGHGLDVFAPEVHDTIEDFVNTQCWAERYPTLEEVGTYIDDLYDPAFTQAIGLASAITGTCGSNALCQKWMARYAEDRPHITGDAAEVPILLVYGLEDTAIDKGRMACAVERLVVQDGASLTGCIDPDAVHDNIQIRQGDHVNRWIEWQLLGGSEPSGCPQGLEAFVTQDGTEFNMVVPCTIPPLND